MKDEKCVLCRFFKSVGDVGECRRFPPKPDGKGLHSVDEFPTVRRESYWCGEFKKKGAKK